MDTVVAGVGWIPFEMPIGEFVEEARGTGCAVYGCLEGLRPLVDDNALRGAAYRYWEAGADGIYLYNYFTLPPSWIRRTLPQLADPAKLKHSSKRYEADHADRIQYGDTEVPSETPSLPPRCLLPLWRHPPAEGLS